MKNKLKYSVLIISGLLIVITALLLPGEILKEKKDMENEIKGEVPKQYYSSVNSVMARNASANLNDYDRLRLISGEWNSEVYQISKYEMETEDFEAAEAVRNSTKDLFSKGEYPVDLSSQYGNWYSWEAVAYKAVDSIFNTYTAYYWDISFSKYDSSEIHHALVLEDGYVFFLENGEQVYISTEDSLKKLENVN